MLAGQPHRAGEPSRCREGCVGPGGHDLRDAAVQTGVWRRSLRSVPPGRGAVRPLGTVHQMVPVPAGEFEMVSDGLLTGSRSPTSSGDGTYYDRSPIGDPTGPEHGSFGAMRGGSWRADAVQLRAAHRWSWINANGLGVGLRWAASTTRVSTSRPPVPTHGSEPPSWPPSTWSARGPSWASRSGWNRMTARPPSP